MTQDQLILLLFKIVVVSGALSVLSFIAAYTMLAPWWRDEIGRTIIVKDILLFLVLIPTVLSLFFHFSRLTSRAAGWADIVFLGAMTPVMLWRIRIWFRVHAHRKDED